MVWTVELALEFEPELLALAAEVRIELLAQARVIERFGPQAKRPAAFGGLLLPSIPRGERSCW